MREAALLIQVVLSDRVDETAELMSRCSTENESLSDSIVGVELGENSVCKQLCLLLNQNCGRLGRLQSMKPAPISDSIIICGNHSSRGRVENDVLEAPDVDVQEISIEYNRDKAKISITQGPASYHGTSRRPEDGKGCTALLPTGTLAILCHSEAEALMLFAAFALV